MGRNYFFPPKPHRPIPPATIIGHALINAVAAAGVLSTITMLARLL